MRKSMINTSLFKLDPKRSNEEDGKVFAYTFPVMFYKKIPVVFATIYTCQNRNNELQLEVSSGNELYPLWYASGEFGVNTIVPQIKRVISQKLLRDIVRSGYGIIWRSNTLIEVQRDYGSHK